MSEAALELRNVVRTYRQAERNLEVLQGVALSIQPGELVALVGPSGAGKSTLLHVAGLLEHPDGGDIVIDGRPCGAMSEGERTLVRRKDIGFVYQFHHLMPEFSALENVMIPQMLAGTAKSVARERALALLDLVGLGERQTHRPAKLSGGEQQRVAIARALANRPLVLLADEPTGNLDHKTADDVFDMFSGFVREANLAALVATHNMDLARRMDRIIRLEDGHLKAA
ncbi:MAG: ATP-binding cassette domain-containing protein [Alphaproteobacteria bacterium]|nr:ATP-binding cassette domain-containing protein [Alphaproteobacteria bacterium]